MANTYGRIVSNRYAIKRFLADFAYQKRGGEILVSPRPQAGTYQKVAYQYLVLLKLEVGSLNHEKFAKDSRFERLSAKDFAAQVKSIQYSWTA